MKPWRSLVRWLVAGALVAVAGAAAAASTTVDYGLFGTLHLSRPATPATRMLLLFADGTGWSARDDMLGAAFARAGALVVGIDTRAYLARMESIKDACSYPAGHVEEVAHWIARHEGLASYSAPLLVGDGAGASFAYAVAMQAPAGTFEGLVTLGWRSALHLPKPICAGDTGAMTRADGAAGYRIMPVARPALPWWPRPFANGATIDGLGAPLARLRRWLGALWPPLAQRPPPVAAQDLYRDWRARQDAATPALPDDVADLPLTEVEPVGDASARIVIMLTGDGGWAGLDRGVAQALAARGMRVIGLSTLKFFWHTQTPQASADAVARVMAHYARGHDDARFVLVGYSFGASLVPVVLNRLPPALRSRVDLGVMISPDDSAVFEIHVGDWFGSTRHEGALPLGPELDRNTTPLLCVQGADEDDSYCRKPLPANVRQASLPGGHHYDGDYAALGDLIARRASAGQTP